MALEYSKEMYTGLILLSFDQNNKVSGRSCFKQTFKMTSFRA